jgi:hypothetical protein
MAATRSPFNHFLGDVWSGSSWWVGAAASAQGDAGFAEHAVGPAVGAAGLGGEVSDAGTLGVLVA